MVTKAPTAAAWNWAGLYIGANAGVGVGRVVTGANFGDALLGEPLSGGHTANRLNGGIFGVQAGYNWMPRALLVGIEGDVQMSRQRADVTAFCPGDICNPLLAPLDAPVIASFEHRLPWFGTLRGRVGTPITPHLLPYVTAGVAFGEIKSRGTLAGFDAIGNPLNAAFSHTAYKAGWTVGGGIEARLVGDWTAKAEYLYMDFGSLSIAPALPADATVAATINPRLTDNILRAGLNYKLN